MSISMTAGESTDTATPTADPAARRKGIPGWAAALIVLAVLAGGGYVVWSFYNGLQTAGAGSTVVLDEKPSEYRNTERADRAAFRQRQRQQEIAAQREQELKGPDFVKSRPNGGIEVKGGNVRLVSAKPVIGTTQIRLEPMDLSLISDDARQTLLLAGRILQDDALARQLEVTPEQKTALKAVPRNINFLPDPATRKSLDALVTAWEKAAPDAKKPAADALIAAVTDFDQKNSPAFLPSLSDRVAKIKAILKPEQIEKFKNMGK